MSSIFAPSAADQAEAGNLQSVIEDGEGAQIAPPMPELPGLDGGESVGAGGGGDFDTKSPDVLMPGGPMDPTV